MKPYDTLGALISKINWYLNSYIKKLFVENNIEITVDQWILVIIINRNPGINQTQLAKSAQKDKAAVTRMLDLLSKNGYIKRENHEKDRRTYRIFLTKKGKDVFDRTLPLSELAEQNMFQDLSNDEIKNMMSSLTKIRNRTKELLN